MKTSQEEGEALDKHRLMVVVRWNEFALNYHCVFLSIRLHRIRRRRHHHHRRPTRKFNSQIQLIDPANSLSEPTKCATGGHLNAQMATSDTALESIRTAAAITLHCESVLWPL